MATSKSDVLSEIAAYTAANGRPCPAKHLTDKFGADAQDVIKTLKAEGIVAGKRGRTGGLIASGTATVETTTEESASQTDSTGDDLAAEFAALAAKLAEAQSQDTTVAATG